MESNNEENENEAEELEIDKPKKKKDGIVFLFPVIAESSFFYQ